MGVVGQDPDSAARASALTVQREAAVVVARWDREASRNALDPPTLLHLAEVLRDAEADDACGACVLTGAGSVAFSAGMDLKALAADRGAVGPAVAAWTSAISSPGRKPLIAAVNGMAMGGGFEIAMQCDLIVAADHATFGLPEVKRGLVPGGGGLQLGTRIPLPTALELALTGEPMTAARLHELGFVNRVVPGPELLTAAIALATTIAGFDAETVARIRRGMWAAVTGGTT